TGRPCRTRAPSCVSPAGSPPASSPRWAEARPEQAVQYFLDKRVQHRGQAHPPRRRNMPAILFGSIGAVAETSELQRAAFNQAFEAHGLDWNWSREEYQDLLRESGGARRIAAFAAERGDDVDAAAVHETKSELFRRNLADAAPGPRESVPEVIAAARESGFQ